MRHALLILGLLVLVLTANVQAQHAVLGDAPEAVVVGPEALAAAVRAAARQAAVAVAKAARSADDAKTLTVLYPLAGAVFPRDFASPTFRWNDPTGADSWLIDLPAGPSSARLCVLTSATTPAVARDADPRSASKRAAAYNPPPEQAAAKRWRPRRAVWEHLRDAALERTVTLTILGFHSAAPQRVLSRGVATFRTSRDPVGAPIFYRDVPLPFAHALRNLKAIRWRLADVASYQPARVLLTDMKVCGNCHSFTRDGRTIGMDVDYGSDKGSYIISDVRPKTIFAKDQVISWSDYRRHDGRLTFGLLAQLSPDGRYAISTVKDRSVFSSVDDLHYSQRFFPVQGILVVYDRQARRFFALPGASDEAYVQSNPVWTPDGKELLFARGKAHRLEHLKDQTAAVVRREEVQEFFEGGKMFRYDLYRMPFAGGKGGPASPVKGASGNGKSNYFPRFSPDGKWIVFCQARTFMLLQPDSELFIMPAAGGTPRRMRCNFTGKMNSWHSWSPNGRWLVFATKADGPFTRAWLTHIDSEGNDTPPVLLEGLAAADRAVNIPEFVNVPPGRFARIEQQFADYYTNYRAGAILERRAQYAEAIEAFREALAEKPDHYPSLLLLTLSLARSNQERRAIPYAERLVKLQPDGSVPRGLLGGLLANAGRYGEAKKHLEIGYTKNPRDVGAASSLAWVLATSPDASVRDGMRAVALAELACRATGGQVAPLMDTLGAAYAENGQFDQAGRAAARAVALARAQKNASTPDYIARMKLYQARRPFRHTPKTAPATRPAAPLH